MMKFTFVFISVLLLSVSLALFVAPKANAIIILAPILLIPILNIIGGITALLGLPTAIFSFIVTYVRKPKTKKAFFIEMLVTCLIILLLIAVSVAVVLKIQNPERPLL